MNLQAVLIKNKSRARCFYITELRWNNPTGTSCTWQIQWVDQCFHQICHTWNMEMLNEGVLYRLGDYGVHYRIYAFTCVETNMLVCGFFFQLTRELSSSAIYIGNNALTWGIGVLINKIFVLLHIHTCNYKEWISSVKGQPIKCASERTAKMCKNISN